MKRMQSLRYLSRLSLPQCVSLFLTYSSLSLLPLCYSCFFFVFLASHRTHGFNNMYVSLLLVLYHC
jgi:hypothetical protein